MADKELAKVRTKFVKKVTMAVIKQLLDDLLDAEILNDGEIESLLEENKSRADRARCLIDTMKKKGDAASRKMINSIKEIDKTLYSELGLSCAAEAPKMQEQTTTHTSTTDKVQRKKRNEEDVYPVTQDSFKSRVALLVNNINFSRGLLNRRGAEKDEENMEKLLKDLGYEVVKHRDLTGEEINDALIEFSKHQKLKTTDSVVVVIMSHGAMGAIYGVNEEMFPTDNIYKHLGSRNCKDLLHKPKIIIIQGSGAGARGSSERSDHGAEAVASDDTSQDDALRLVHKEKDFITLLCSTPGTVSYRHIKSGSFLIQFIVEIFNKAAREDHIHDLFRKVLRRFENFPMGRHTQMPCIDRYSLPRHFYFFPDDQDV